MQSQSKSPLLNDLSAKTAPHNPCTKPYGLNGPQVEPSASHWLGCGTLRLLNEAEMTAAVTARQADPTLNPDGIPAGLHYPADADTVNAELEELIQLARLRDEPGQLAHKPHDPDATKESQRLRLPLSFFLQMRPQPLGAVVNTARDQHFPVIATGREMARYVENETPGMPFQVALNYMIRETSWSPPRQAVVWAGLSVAIASALEAAWYYKWRGGPGVEYRPRPWECHHDLEILFDRASNSTNSADGPRRSFPAGSLPYDFKGGEPYAPEQFVADVLAPQPNSAHQPTPGTPRHPAYPSGHSTYSAAAAEYLASFFPDYRNALDRLADNIGLGRLWAGIHWRTDHTFGQLVGRAVGHAVFQQIATSCIKDQAPGSIFAPPPQGSVPLP